MKKYIFLLSICFLFLSTASYAQNWLLTGNSGTNPSTNFIGTKDTQALVFKTNRKERMRILSNGKIGIGTSTPSQRLDINGNINLAKGFSLYMENHPVFRVDSLNGNTFLGNSIAPNVTGGENSAVGSYALYSNTSGNYNTALAPYALYSNSSGNDNVAIGYSALTLNISAIENTAIGNYALYYNIGDHNTAIGTYALYDNKLGVENVATGRQALYSNSLGSYNTANGTEALNNTNADFNTATGYRALYTNTAGYNNTAHGVQALYKNVVGVNNTAMGINALFSNTGSYNTAIGENTLNNTTSAWGNTAVGDVAGASYNNGYYNTFIGAETDATAPDIYNSTALGRGTRITASSQVRIGNSFVTSIGGYASWSNISDGRVKKNIKQDVPGLTFINKLRPITYNLDLDAADRILQPVTRKDKDGKIVPLSQIDISARNAKQQVIYTGFVAQEVEKAAKELNYNFSGVDAAKSNKDLYGLRYSEFVVPLVKAVQELSKMNDDKNEVINDLTSRLEKLEALMNTQSSAPGSKLKTIGISDASLEQNQPNPFSVTTTINYTLPQQFNAAKIIITDNSGKTLKETNVSGKGKGSLNVDASTLSSGTYQYSLIVDGKLITTKQMLLTK